MCAPGLWQRRTLGLCGTFPGRPRCRPRPRLVTTSDGPPWTRLRAGSGVEEGRGGSGSWERGGGGGSQELGECVKGVVGHVFQYKNLARGRQGKVCRQGRKCVWVVVVVVVVVAGMRLDIDSHGRVQASQHAGTHNTCMRTHVCAWPPAHRPLQSKQVPWSLQLSALGRTHTQTRTQAKTRAHGCAPHPHGRPTSPENCWSELSTKPEGDTHTRTLPIDTCAPAAAPHTRAGSSSQPHSPRKRLEGMRTKLPKVGDERAAANCVACSAGEAMHVCLSPEPLLRRELHFISQWLGGRHVDLRRAATWKAEGGATDTNRKAAAGTWIYEG